MSDSELETIQTISLPLPPSANVYWRHTAQSGHVAVHLSSEALAYRDAVGWLCAVAGIRSAIPPVRVTAHCYICDKRRDLDNNIKQLLDALQGFAYENDNAVEEIHVYRHKAKTRKASKVIVTIEPIGVTP